MTSLWAFMLCNLWLQQGLLSSRWLSWCHPELTFVITWKVDKDNTGNATFWGCTSGLWSVSLSLRHLNYSWLLYEGRWIFSVIPKDGWWRILLHMHTSEIRVTALCDSYLKTELLSSLTSIFSPAVALLTGHVTGHHSLIPVSFISTLDLRARRPETSLNCSVSQCAEQCLPRRRYVINPLWMNEQADSKA